MSLLPSRRQITTCLLAAALAGPMSGCTGAPPAGQGNGNTHPGNVNATSNTNATPVASITNSIGLPAGYTKVKIEPFWPDEAGNPVNDNLAFVFEQAGVTSNPAGTIGMKWPGSQPAGTDFTIDAGKATCLRITLPAAYQNWVLTDYIVPGSGGKKHKVLVFVTASAPGCERTGGSFTTPIGLTITLS